MEMPNKSLIRIAGYDCQSSWFLSGGFSIYEEPLRVEDRQ